MIGFDNTKGTDPVGCWHASRRDHLAPVDLP